jgi:hypothetical protein
MSNASLFSQLEGLWIQAGGSAALAPLMAGIGLNEGAVSDPLGINKDSGNSYSAGIWQINSANWGGLEKYGIISSPQDLTDPLVNAKAAVYLAGKNGQNIADTWQATYAKGQAAALQYGLTSAPTPNPYPNIVSSLNAPAQGNSGSGNPYVDYGGLVWKWLTGQLPWWQSIVPWASPGSNTPSPFAQQSATWPWLIVAGGIGIIALAIIVANHSEEITVAVSKGVTEGAKAAA